MTTWQWHQQQQSCASKRSRVPRRIEQRAAPCMSHPTKSHGRAWGREEGGVRRERCGGGGGGCSGGDDDRDGNVGLRCEGGRGLGWWRWWIELVCPLSFAVHLSNFLSVCLPVSVFPVSLCLSLCLSFCLSFCLSVSVCLCLSLPLSPSLLSVCLDFSLSVCLPLSLATSVSLSRSLYLYLSPPPLSLSHYLYPVSKRNPWQTWAADAEVNFFVCYSVCLSRKPHGIGFRMSACVCGV